MGINIGKNTVRGDQTIIDGPQTNIGRDQVNVGPAPREVRRSLDDLIDEARRLLPPERFAGVAEAIRGIDSSMSSADPDRRKAASRLGTAVELMQQSGAALEAGSSLAQGITRIAQWIGPIAGSVLAGVGLLP
ncbi:hypothetical protein ACDF64_14090 [Agromyces sp. MMS24-JH15]|uniref:hypothetical protein n=1 Tax=Agromyces sp. MMS24-JH15 TaxID=3243765 RepID=UPI00374A41C7